MFDVKSLNKKPLTKKTQKTMIVAASIAAIVATGAKPDDGGGTGGTGSTGGSGGTGGGSGTGSTGGSGSTGGTGGGSGTGSGGGSTGGTGGSGRGGGSGSGGTPNVAPVLNASGLSVSVAENQSIVVRASATDSGDLTFAISGTDAGKFDIDETSGAITFKADPDYENALDADGQNDYELTVTVTDEDGASTSEMRRLA